MPLDQAKRTRMLEFFAAKWKKDRSITVFGNTEEAEGLPTLCGMTELAASKKIGATIRHVGMGVFLAETYIGSTRLECFCFLGGGAMDHVTLPGTVTTDFAYCTLQVTQEHRWAHGYDNRNPIWVLAACKKLFPAGWAYLKDEAKRKRDLVAAAPKMLEACEKAFAAMMDFEAMIPDRSEGSILFLESFEGVQPILSAAIRAARGVV